MGKVEIARYEQFFLFQQFFLPKNTVTKTDYFPLPKVHDCMDKIANTKYVTKFDPRKEILQVLLTETAEQISASGCMTTKLWHLG